MAEPQSSPSRIRRYLIWLALPVAVLVLGAAWVVLRMGIWFSVQIAPPDLTTACDRAWTLLKFCLGVGGLTMALVQIVRMIVPLRGYFHRQQLLEWLRRSGEGLWPFPEALKSMEGLSYSLSADVAGRALQEFEGRSEKVATEESGEQNKPGESPPPEKQSAKQDSVRAYARSLYDSPIEQLCAQLNVAIETSLDDPWRKIHFLLGFLGDEGIEPLIHLHGARKEENVTPPAAGAPQGFNLGGSPVEAVTKDDSELLEKAKARGRLTQLTHARIDAFQIETAGRWRHRLRLMVILTSATLSAVVTIGTTLDSELSHPEKIVSVLLYSLLEGLVAAFVAMFLRDVVATVENWRRRA